MTDELDDHVEDRIGDNLATLERAFAAKTVTDQNALESSTSVIGNRILEEEVRRSSLIDPRANKRLSFVPEVETSNFSHSQLALVTKLQEDVARLEQDAALYKEQLEKVRPDHNAVSLLCHKLDIDPAIATVPNLLELLSTANSQNADLKQEVELLTEKLYRTTEVLKQQKELYLDIKHKLRSVGDEGDRRRETYIQDITKFYEEKLKIIEQELKEKGVRLSESFWTPHATNMGEFLSSVMDHKTKVAQDELQRDISNADTDKYSDDEPLIFPVDGFRRTTIIAPNQAVYFEDDDVERLQMIASHEGQRDDKTKVCAIQ